jgi:hypothetical protein
MLAIFLFALPTQAQDISHVPTIADCPAGYVLAVQDTSLPQPLTKPPSQTAIYANDADSIAAQNAAAAAAAEANQQAEAPRQFMTGCVPPSVHQHK